MMQQRLIAPAYGVAPTQAYVAAPPGYGYGAPPAGSMPVRTSALFVCFRTGEVVVMVMMVVDEREW
jgi:hypothetical protein